MNTVTGSRAFSSWLPIWTLLGLITMAAAPARAADDPPGRVGRIAELHGSVSWFDQERGVWLDAERNRPLTSGDRVSTGAQGRAELRVGSSVLRLAASTELEVLRLDDARMSFQLHTGSLALRVRSREVAAETELVTAEVRLRPDRAGHYRVDRIDDVTHAGVLRGTLRIDDPEGFIIETGQRAELWREGRNQRSLRLAWGSLPADAFADWVARDDQRDERSVASRHVSPEMTGAEELDRHGRWDRHPDHGAIWFPTEVRVGWAPYRDGRWAWVQPWGWTWVDESSWGFAPFHYGRWVNWRGRWGWTPGEYVARPVYAPALVAWVGGPHIGVSISIGGPSIGWVPLAPREVYVPRYRHTPVYVERVNPRPPGHHYVHPVPTGPVMYGNQGVPGAVTVVPRDVLVQRQPVPRTADDGRRWQHEHGNRPVVVVAPPAPDPMTVRPQAGPRVEHRSNEHEQDRERDRDRGPGRRHESSVGAPQRAEPVAPAPVQSRPLPQWQAPQAPAQPQQAAPQAQPQPQSGPVVDLRRERPMQAAPQREAPSVAAPQPQSQPQSQPKSQPQSQPQPQAQPPAPVRAAPAQPLPQAAPPVVPRPAPQPAPERAREREREREAQRDSEREKSRDEERKRGPEGRNSRERENPR